VLSSGDRYTTSADSVETYRLGSEDKIRVSIFNEPQLSGDYMVGGDGNISLPLVGNVQVAGKTVNEASVAVQALLSRDFIRNPVVAIQVDTYRPIYIIGEVRAPGTYPYSPGMSLWDAIAKGGGLTPRGRDDRVFIRKVGEQGELQYKLRPDLRVWPGDTIRIPERFF
jgi:polysaccharide export outer membrane protein